MSQLMVVKNSFWAYVRLTWEMSKFSLLSAMEYRMSFWVKIFGMIVNDLFHIFAWVVLYQSFHGWVFQDTALLFAIFLTMSGIFIYFAAGTLHIAKNIAEGKLDYYLSLPKNPLWHMVVDRTEIFGLADVVIGIVLFALFGNPDLQRILLFLGVVFISIIILIAYTIFVQSLAFFVGDFEETAERWFWTLFGFGFYPQNIFFGPMKLVTLTVLPAFFVFTVPTRLLTSFDWMDLLLLVLVAAASFLISIQVFQIGLKRYESGNLINVRI
jgi:ABC-2 type transport system permease protein